MKKQSNLVAIRGGVRTRVERYVFLTWNQTIGTKQSLCFSLSSYNIFFSLCFQYCAVMEAYNVHLVRHKP